MNTLGKSAGKYDFKISLVFELTAAIKAQRNTFNALTDWKKKKKISPGELVD